MPTPVNPPELIISLSQNRIKLQLVGQDELGRSAWHSTFPVQGAFLEDQVATALDSALSQNPTLLDQFETVDVVVVDRPNICIPQFYVNNGKLAEIAARHLRLRAGDTLTMDQSIEDTVIAYTVPSDTISVLKEFYFNAGHLHLASVLWSAIMQDEQVRLNERSRLFFHVAGNSLIVLGQSGVKLSFSRIFSIQDQTDWLYYMVACSRLLRPSENWHVTIQNEETMFTIPHGSQFTFNHQLELPELPALIAQHRLCAS